MAKWIVGNMMIHSHGQARSLSNELHLFPISPSTFQTFNYHFVRRSLLYIISPVACLGSFIAGVMTALEDEYAKTTPKISCMGCRAIGYLAFEGSANQTQLGELGACAGRSMLSLSITRL